MNLDEMKKLYPAYKDMSNEEFGGAIYNKYYKDKMPEETFWEKVRSFPGKVIDTAGKAIPRFADVAATAISGMVAEPLAKTAGMINLLHGEAWGSPEEAFGDEKVKEEAKKERIEYAKGAESDIRNLLQYRPRYPETTEKALEIMGKGDPAQRVLGGAIETSGRLARNLLGERAGYGVEAAATVAPFLIGGEGAVKGATVKGVKGPRPAIRFLDGKKEVIKGKEGTPHVNVYDKLKAGQEERPMETGWWVNGKFEKNMTRAEMDEIVREAKAEREEMRRKAERKGSENDPTVLFTKPMRDFHRSLADRVENRVSKMKKRISEYDGWKWDEGDRIRSDKTGNIITIMGRSWDIKSDSPRYRYKVESTGESGDLVAEKVHEGGFTKMGINREKGKPIKGMSVEDVSRKKTGGKPKDERPFYEPVPNLLGKLNLEKPDWFGKEKEVPYDTIIAGTQMLPESTAMTLERTKTPKEGLRIPGPSTGEKRIEWLRNIVGKSKGEPKFYGMGYKQAMDVLGGKDIPEYSAGSSIGSVVLVKDKNGNWSEAVVRGLTEDKRKTLRDKGLTVRNVSDPYRREQAVGIATSRSLGRETGKARVELDPAYDGYNSPKFRLLGENGANMGSAGIENSAWDGKLVARIHGLEIFGPYRNKGLSGEFLAGLERVAKDMGYPEAILDVEQNNTRAIRAYTRAGYKIVGKGAERSDSGVPPYRMWKELKETLPEKTKKPGVPAIGMSVEDVSGSLSGMSRWRSPTSDMIGQQTETKMPPAEWMKRINAWGQKHPAIADENKWSGIEAYIESRKGEKAISKEDVMGFYELSKGKWAVREQVHGPGREGLDAWIDKNYTGATRDEIKAMSDQEVIALMADIYGEKYESVIPGGKMTPDPWASHNIPGGIEGTEKVYTLSVPPKPLDPELKRSIVSLNRDMKNAIDRYDEFVTSMKNKYGALVRLEGSGSPLSKSESNNLSNLSKLAKEAVERYYSGGGIDINDPGHVTGVKSDYVSPHFLDKPNVVLHFRTQERLDAKGQKGLMIETIQSDWHQTRGSWTSKDEARLQELWDKSEGRIDKKGNYHNLTPEETAEFNYLRNSKATRVDEPPPAPFERSWAEVGLKHALDIAAQDPSIKWVAWPSGKVQMERWGKGNAEKFDFDNPRHNELFDGYYDVEYNRFKRENGRKPNSREEEIINDKVMDRLTDELETGTKKGESDFLEILYDKRLPKFAKKYSEKMGGKYREDAVANEMGMEESRRYSRVEINKGKGERERYNPDTEEGGWEVYDPESRTSDWFATRKEAVDYAAEMDDSVRKASDMGARYPIHRIDITPTMRDTINTKGQSFYKVPLAIGGAAMGANLLGGGRQDNGKNQLSEGVQW